jgi:hypothetical protein
MHLKCPVCGALIPAGQINVHELIAVCPDCNHVFAFNRETVARKSKQRKLNTPARVQVEREDQQLTLSYRRVLGPGPKFGAVMVTIGSIAYSAVALGAAHDGAPPGVVMLFGALALLSMYMLAVFFTTTTRITADEDGIEVKSGPLPFPFKDDKTLSAADISHVAFEKTQEVFPPGMPAHNVYAELHDGERVNVVTSLPREHARYLAATLDDYLRAVEGAEYLIEDDDDALWAESGISDGEIDESVWAADQTAQRRSAG